MRLCDYLKKNKLTQVDFASLIGVSHVQVHWLVHRKRNPSLLLATNIENATNGQVTTQDLLNPKLHPRAKKTKNENT
jgi:DNA-binding transcriptional regulator YdaS (Cro superfamily)